MTSFVTREEAKTLLTIGVGLLLLPYVLEAGGLTMTSAVDCVLFAMAGLGLNLLLGYSGLVSFGHAAWFGLGGYAVAIIQLRFSKRIAFTFGVGPTAYFGSCFAGGDAYFT